MKGRSLKQFHRQKQINRTYRILKWTILACAVLVIAFGTLLFSHRYTKKAAEKILIRRAHQAFKQGETEEAKKLYSEVLQRYPTYDLAHKNMGLIYLEEGNVHKAFEELVRAYHLNRNMTVARDKAMELLLASGDFETTAEEARVLLLADPRSFFLRRTLVLSLAGMGELSKAQEKAEKLIKLHPHEPAGYGIAAGIYGKMDQPDVAEKILLDGVRACPAAPGPRISLGAFYLARGKRAQTEKQYREAIRIDPDGTDGHVALVEYYRSLYDYAKAEAECRLALEKDPGNVSLLYTLSLLFLDRGDEEAAAKVIERLREEAPDHWLTKIARGRLCAIREKRSEAESQMEEAAREMPYQANAYLILAQAELQAAMIRKADEHVGKALRLNPEMNEADILRARIKLGDKKYSESIEVCRKILKQSPGDREALLVQGSAHTAMKENVPAEKCFRELIQRHPQYPAGYLQLGKLLSRQHKYDGAVELLEKAASLQPENMDILRQLAEAYHLSGDHTRAIERCTNASTAMPDSAGPFIIAGDIHGMAAEFDEAQRCFLQAIRKDPGNPLAHIGLGRVYGSRGDMGAAIREFKKAEEIDENLPLANLLLGLALEETGDLETARDHYSRAIRPAPEFMPAITGLARTYLKQEVEETELPSDYGLLVKLGEIFLAAGDLDRADACVKKISRVNAGGLEGLKLKAVLLMARGNMRGTIAVLREVVHSAPHDGSSRYGLAGALYRIGDLEAAAEEAKKACAIAKGDLNGRTLLASIYMAQGHTGKALQEINRVLGAGAGGSEVRRIKAIANLRLGQFSLSEKDLLEILAGNPEDTITRDYLILAYLCQGKLKDAEREFEKDASTPGDFEKALSSLTAICLQEKKEKEGLEMCGFLVREKGESPFLLVEMGKLHAAKEETGKARESFRKALQQDEEYMPAYFSLGMLCQKTGKYDEAIHLYQKALQADPDSLDASLLLANAYTKQAEIDKAIDVYEKALEGRPDIPEILNNLAYLYSGREGYLDKAVELALRAGVLEPDNPAILDTLGWIYYKTGNYEEARRRLEKSAQIRPSHSTTLYHLGMAYYKTGDPNGAMRELKEAIQLGAHLEWSEDARRTLAKIRKR